MSGGSITRQQEVDGYVNRLYPMAFTAQANVMDTPNYWHAVNRPDVHLFEEAMEREMEAMMKLNAWKEIDISEVPYTSDGVRRTVIESIWAFKVKRCPDWTVKKHKAQLCVRGDQQ
eukprot:8561092-Ditylum_brightwellii.AAC.1